MNLRRQWMFRKKWKYMLPALGRYRYYSRIKILEFYKERRIRIPLSEKRKLILMADSDIQIPFMDIDVTTYCNLRCRRCAKYIPYFAEHKHFTADEIKESLDLLTTYVDRICVASIIGGEPFLNPEIAEIIRVCSKNQRIAHLELTTNATIIPNDDVFRALRKGKVLVHISNYPNIDARFLKQEKLIEKLKEYQIPYEFQYHEIWLDFGEVKKRAYSEKELRSGMLHCPMNSCSVYNDKKLYRCGKVSYLAQHGMESGKGEVIDMSRIHDRKEMKRKIKEFYSVKYFEACKYCDLHPKGIAAAEQLEGR